MEYLIIILVFFILMLIYFKIADKYNIIDKPNHRSAHTEITLRGGGIIFPLAYLFFMGYEVLFNNYRFSLDNWGEPNFWIFGAGLLIICLISFIDDMIDLSSKIRLIFHFVAVTLLLYFLNAFQLLPWWGIPISYVLIIGILNAYNFMDGINGMSGLYSSVLLGTLLYINQNTIEFVNADFIIYPLLASIVFLFFNFRKRAKCFLGDIGSMGIGFWIIGLLSLLMFQTGQIKWVLFLMVYGAETILTIMERLKLKENIFDAHRRHLYQLFANDKKISHLTVSVIYAVVQLIINAIVIFSNFAEWVTFIVIALPTIALYLGVKRSVKKELSLSK
ncbi:MraY family glycosyltransferase [Kaistella antarctica]|uniref:UDP-GlcNAc:UDP-phosphate GlcNAc-1-phosphate transferase n=1 Tax=Kaistella antarctica TaxID=266748 RepID=A0A3S4YJW8_9FLAO|nr:glycosyltransferase family 4 protein [Kaistella antarctica]KEY18834.1 UDP-GlcNAc:UDP-phosphate GlcNAc-1-phosphate transferase [Kaistella antarctica]SEW14883.1 UDP-N-acetylmuramyl pentapeptide phosphotransferase/UDP-N-acetylglucosamine-1-phosphate transferase [Kaistella antarctica]VEH99402.1 Undecaprenyl-phosphate alpha-N-acetylglucosaminyl 1-phosphate transferase [Kaistella antarctica]